MKRYIQADIKVNSQDQKDMLIAALSELGFEGFEEERTTLKAFISESEFNEAAFEAVLLKFAVTCSTTVVEDQNWNQIWESGFEPVVIGDFCAVRADFHPPVPGVQYEILITPKMSFGTGHHATTHMMIESMKDIYFKEKSVFDFGTGTGVLAILAEQLLASRILAIDNDEWSIENAMENLQRNGSRKITIDKLEGIPSGMTFDIILANINKHVITGQMHQISEALLGGGVVLFSGLLSEDEPEVDALAATFGLKLANKKEQHNWICLNYVKKS